MRNWPNMELMSQASMSLKMLTECVDSWGVMGVKGVHLTGGGEPLQYKQLPHFLTAMSLSDMELFVTTNGTMFNTHLAHLFRMTSWRKVAISIDAGEPATYARVHRVPEDHWYEAFEGLSLFSQCKTTPGHDSGQEVGVSFVVCPDNFGELYAAATQAKARGADFVEFSLAMTPHEFKHFPPGAVEEVTKQIKLAQREIAEDSFFIRNYLPQDTNNLAAGRQDYEFCNMKEVTCVVGGDGNVYTCPSKAFTRSGLVGSVENQTFKDLWESSERRIEYFSHSPESACHNTCSYHGHNKRIDELAEYTPDQLDALVRADDPNHVNLI